MENVYYIPDSGDETESGLSSTEGSTIAHTPAGSGETYLMEDFSADCQPLLDEPPAHEPSTPQRLSEQTVVTVQPSNSSTGNVVTESMERPATYLWLACLVYWLCNCICGGTAFVESVAAGEAADEGRFEEAKRHAKWSFTLSIFGLGCGLIGWTYLLFLLSQNNVL